MTRAMYVVLLLVIVVTAVIVGGVAMSGAGPASHDPNEQVATDPAST